MFSGVLKTWLWGTILANFLLRTSLDFWFSDQMHIVAVEINIWNWRKFPLAGGIHRKNSNQILPKNSVVIKTLKKIIFQNLFLFQPKGKLYIVPEKIKGGKCFFLSDQNCNGKNQLYFLHQLYLLHHQTKLGWFFGINSHYISKYFPYNLPTKMVGN